MPADLPTFQQVLDTMLLKDGPNPVPENFILTFDLTQTYITSSKTFIPGLSPLGLNEAVVRNDFLIPTYTSSTYTNVLSATDVSNAAYPADISRWRAPYIDSEFYTININKRDKRWNLEYDNGSTKAAILSGKISSDYKALVGFPIKKDAMIEFPVSGAGGWGQRVVYSNGSGRKYYKVNIERKGAGAQGRIGGSVATRNAIKIKAFK